MKRIFDSEKIEQLAKDYGITSFFNTDIIPYMELLYYEPNEYLIHEGEPLKYLYFILQGKVKIYVSVSNGKSVLVCFYEGLQVLGEVELVSGNPASTSVQTIDEIYCLGIPSEKIGSIMLNDQKFLRYALVSLSEKITRSVQNSSINLLYPLENRLSSYILATSEKTMIFNENLTEISELLATSYRHLLRTLNILTEKGALTKKGRSYLISNLDLLKNLASDVYR